MSEIIEPWRHVGRVYSHGEQYLVLDPPLLDSWHGTDEEVDELIDLGTQATTVPVGAGAAGIVAVDTSIDDQGWLEVFRRGDDRLTVVQGVGEPYRDVMVAALLHAPTGSQADEGVVEIASGDLALWNSAVDGREAGTRLRAAEAGQLPTGHSPLHAGSPPPPVGLRVPVRAGTFRLDVVWRLELSDDASFARWSLTREPG